jgi:DNA-directed RNA polymerase subunit alpha
MNDTNTLLNPAFSVVEVSSTGREATIVIEPLEQGYGHTLGNALRRTLLSSLTGHAVTFVKVDGVDHQFTTLEGMSEDIVELVLNVKLLRIKSDRQDAGILRLNVTGPAEVTAKDIEAEAGFEIVNLDQHIATLAKGKSLKLELKVEAGMGYSMARDRVSSLIGEVPVDALFSPVEKVSYKVEATRVGRRTDFDKLVMVVQTDGSIDPINAVRESARILTRQFAQVVDPVVPMTDAPMSSVSPEEAEVLRLTVEELDLPTRIANALRKGGFKAVQDLVGAKRDTIAKVKNLGEKSVDVINDALLKKGVSLGE